VLLEPFKADYQSLYEAHRLADDDFFYVGSAYWGIPWLEAILGCPVVAGANTCWAEPCLDDIDPGLELEWRPETNCWLDCLVRFTKELMAFSAGRFPVCAPLLRGPGDAASAMRGAAAVVTDCLDYPEAAGRLLAHCAEVRLAVLDRLRAVIPPWRGTHAAGGYPSRLWSRRTVAYNQEDSAALLSPQLFADRLLPLERQMCRAAEVNFIHLHSGCLYPVDALLADGSYDVLEINIDRDGSGPTLSRILPTLQRIQEAGRPLLLWGEINRNGWRLLQSQLSPAGLGIQPIVKTPAETTRFRLWSRKGTVAR